jgi:polar amino acid transport system substrate-binding protein
MAGKIDIIMSGMTLTQGRTMQVDFTAPYFQVGLLACMRAEDIKKYDSLERMTKSNGNVGVIPGSSADAFVTRQFPRARKIAIAKAEHAALELETRRIDLFVADGPAVAWLVSRNEADLTAFWHPLVREEFAWGVRRGDRELLTAVNGILARWKSDGTLHRVLHHWLPYLDRIGKDTP